MKTFLKLLLLSLITGFILPVFSQVQTSDDPYFQFVADMGYGWGGDKIYEGRWDVYEENYYTGHYHYEGSERFTIRAGEGALFRIGGILALPAIPLEIMTTAGYMVASESGEDDDYTFDRKVIDVVGYYPLGINRFGAGFTFHLSPSFEYDDGWWNETINFKDATGLLLEYGLHADWARFYVRAQWLDYEAEDYDWKVSANSVALGVGFVIG